MQTESGANKPRSVNSHAFGLFVIKEMQYRHEEYYIGDEDGIIINQDKIAREKIYRTHIAINRA